MSKHCENCGTRYYSVCSNCYEAIVIQDQYIELEMEVPEAIVEQAAAEFEVLPPEQLKSLRGEK